MKIKLNAVKEEGTRFVGDERSSIFDTPEKFFKFENPVHYDLEATWVGDNNLLVRGTLSTIVKAQCVRSLEWFDLPIEVPDFQSHHADIQGDEVDLTEEIREDILILLPAYPISPKAKPLEAGSPPEMSSGSDAWGELDKLKLKKN